MKGKMLFTLIYFNAVAIPNVFILHLLENSNQYFEKFDIIQGWLKALVGLKPLEDDPVNHKPWH